MVVCLGDLQNSPLSPAGRNTCGAFSIGLYMPLMKLCGYPGCGQLIPQGENYCPLHKKKAAEWCGEIEVDIPERYLLPEGEDAE